MLCAAQVFVASLSLSHVVLFLLTSVWSLPPTPVPPGRDGEPSLWSDVRLTHLTRLQAAAGAARGEFVTAAWLTAMTRHACGMTRHYYASNSPSSQNYAHKCVNIISGAPFKNDWHSHVFIRLILSSREVETWTSRISIGCQNWKSPHQMKSLYWLLYCPSQFA